jgi:hypothetical protein
MVVRNPFKLLTSEQIKHDEMFLGIFEPGILEMLQKEGESLWNRLYIIRSSPGGGKTTLLRLFTPQSLKTLHSLKSRENYREVFDKLKKLNVLDEKSVYTLGVMLSCSRGKSYTSIEDLKIDENKKKKLLFGLLNCRIIISALRGICLLADLHFPEELDSVYIDSQEWNTLLCCPHNCSGSELFDWAQKREERIFNIIEGLTPEIDYDLLDNTVSSLYIITPESISVNSFERLKHVVIMLDDFHELGRLQGELIKNEIESSRFPVGVWICERLEALREEELLSTNKQKKSNIAQDPQMVIKEELITRYISAGNRIGRDFETLRIENFWEENSPEKNEKLMLEIANRRLKYAEKGSIISFKECLLDSLDTNKLYEILEILSSRIEGKILKKAKYEKWLEFCISASDSEINKILKLKVLEILIERDKRKKQTTLSNFDKTIKIRVPVLSSEEFQRKYAGVKPAAELFISEEFNVPYYFGWDKISRISSYNMEQFIYLCSHLFEEFLSSSLISAHTSFLSPREQERVLIDATEKRLISMINRMPRKEEIRMFIDAIGQYSKWETYRPNAPYSPGVTGVAINMENLYSLNNYTKYESLRSVISECIKQNLLFPKPERKCKHKEWMILYLNRMICVKYKLPLHYGGWREKPLSLLDSWVKKGFEKQKRRG